MGRWPAAAPFPRRATLRGLSRPGDHGHGRGHRRTQPRRHRRTARLRPPPAEPGDRVPGPATPRRSPAHPPRPRRHPGPRRARTCGVDDRAVHRHDGRGRRDRNDDGARIPAARVRLPRRVRARREQPRVLGRRRTCDPGGRSHRGAGRWLCALAAATDRAGGESDRDAHRIVLGHVLRARCGRLLRAVTEGSGRTDPRTVSGGVRRPATRTTLPPERPLDRRPLRERRRHRSDRALPPSRR